MCLCRNEGYGSGARDNPIVFGYIQNYTDILLTNFPGHSPVIEFDGAGGISMAEMSRVEISGGILLKVTCTDLGLKAVPRFG